MDFYELKHFGCTYWMDEKGLSPADVALQCGHADGGALMMSTYGHPSEKRARERIQSAWETNTRRHPPAEACHVTSNLSPREQAVAGLY